MIRGPSKKNPALRPPAEGGGAGGCSGVLRAGQAAIEDGRAVHRLVKCMALRNGSKLLVHQALASSGKCQDPFTARAAML